VGRKEGFPADTGGGGRKLLGGDPPEEESRISEGRLGEKEFWSRGKFPAKRSAPISSGGGKKVEGRTHNWGGRELRTFRSLITKAKRPEPFPLSCEHREAFGHHLSCKLGKNHHARKRRDPFYKREEELFSDGGEILLAVLRGGNMSSGKRERSPLSATHQEGGKGFLC